MKGRTSCLPLSCATPHALTRAHHLLQAHQPTAAGRHREPGAQLTGLARCGQQVGHHAGTQGIADYNLMGGYTMQTGIGTGGGVPPASAGIN